MAEEEKSMKRRLFEAVAIPLVKAFAGCILGGLIALLWAVGCVERAFKLEVDDIVVRLLQAILVPIATLIVYLIVVCVCVVMGCSKLIPTKL